MIRAVADAVGGLLVVAHSRTGSTQVLTDAAVAAARGLDTTEVRVRDAFAAEADDVLWCAGVLLSTPARFGYMSGAMKDFFERVYHPCLDHTRGLPYALITKGDTDVDGAVASVERIATGMAWRRVLPVLAVVGDVTPDQLEQAQELGGSLAAGLDAGIF